MIVAVLPEASAWLAALPSAPDTIFAPWHVGKLAVFGRVLGARIRAALARRQLATHAHVETRPAWLGVEALAGAWAGHDVGRRLATRFMLRRGVDALAASWLPRDARVVIAPTGCAERVFARAAALGAERVLVMDAPCLRRLHADLDEAALCHPDARFLRRFRAPAREIARQEAEWTLATRVLVRGDYAAQILATAGVAGVEIMRPASIATSRPAARQRVFLAGGGAARGGSIETLAALDELPGLSLVLTPGEGLEPARLMRHPRVRTATPAERERLEGIDAVLAPSWCEAYPRELTLARRLGIARICTLQTAGPGDLVLARGDAAAVARALRACVKLQ